MKIGVISDTHGYLDPAIRDIFRGVDRILHAGDVGSGVLEGLQAIAPVDAVAGNMDGEPLTSRLPRLLALELGGRKLLLVHRADELRVRARIEAGGVELVVHGHTHKAGARRKGGALLFNPGAAGRSMVWGGRSVGLLELDERGIHHRIIRLDR